MFPVPDDSTGSSKETLGLLDTLDGVRPGNRLCAVVLREAIDLVNVKNRVSLHEGNGALSFLAGGAIGLGADNLVDIGDKAALLTLRTSGVSSCACLNVIQMGEA